MKTSRTIVAALTLLFIIGVIALPAQAAAGIQGRQQEAKAPAAKSSTPKEIQAVIQEGLATREGRQDIPFSFFKKLVLPAQGDNLYPIFFIKAKNGDLGYAPSAAGTGMMETTLNAFYEFYRADDAGALKPVFGGKTQALLTVPGEGYSAEEEDWYTFGLALPAGQYTLALVLGTPDMKKLSVGYCDVTLPGPEAHAATLMTTDPIVVTAMEQVEPDQRPTIHRGFFTWGAAKIETNAACEIASGENLEVLFFVLGAEPKDPAAPRPALDLEVNFEVQTKDGQPAIKWSPQSYELYLVNQPLPLFQTLQKVDEKGTVLSTDKKPLDPGEYDLAVTVTDKVSGKTANTKMAFTVK